MAERGHLNVCSSFFEASQSRTSEGPALTEVRCAPVRPLFALEPEGRQAAIISTGSRQPCLEEVGVGEQVRGHEGAVCAKQNGFKPAEEDAKGASLTAVAADGHLLSVRHAHVHHRVDRGGSGADELLDEAVVRLGVTLAEDWKRRAI